MVFNINLAFCLVLVLLISFIFNLKREYPSVSQKASYTAFVKACYDQFVADAQRTGKPRLLLSAATAPDSRMNSLDLPELNK